MRHLSAPCTLFVAFVLTLAACTKKAEPDAPLAFAPADTPYVFANLEPLPKATVDEMLRSYAPLISMYDTMLDQAASDLERTQPNTLQAKVLRALAAELKGKLTPEGIESLGLSTQARSAMYGIGLVPVARVELKDPKAFEAFVARVEGRVGEKLPTAAIDGQSYWRVVPQGSPLGVAAAIHSSDLVISLIPTQASDDLLRRVLGLTRPEATMASGERLTNLNRQWSLTPYGSGYIDTVRLATALMDEKTGIEKEFLTALGVEQPVIDSVCRQEVLGLVNQMPRLLLGFTRYDAKRQDAVMALELKPDLAAMLTKLSAPVPGLGAPTAGVMEIGMSLDFVQLSDVLKTKAAAVTTAPFQCAALTQVNTGLSELQGQLSNPMLLTSASMLKGFRLALTSFEMPAGGETPKISGKLVLASDDPSALLAMARMFVPQIDALKLAPGGDPVALPAELAPPGIPPVHLALGEKAVGIALGDGEQAGLKAFMTADGATGNVKPLFALGYSGRFYGAMAKAFRDPAMAATIAQADAQPGSPDGNPNALSQAELEQMATTFEQVEKLLNRIDMTMLLTDKGIEVRSVTEFR